MSQTQAQLNPDMPRDTDAAPSRKPATPLIWLLLLVVLAAGGWWFTSNRDSSTNSSSNTTPTTDTPAPAIADNTAASANKPASSKPPAAAKAQRGERAKASTPDRAPALLSSNPQPKYPPAALRAGASGTVLLDVQVDAQGAPSQITIAKRSGNRELDRAAMKAASDWRFSPAVRDGKAVAQMVKVPVEFSAQ